MTKALVQAPRASAEIVEMTGSIRPLPGSETGRPMVELSGLYKSYGGLQVLKAFISVKVAVMAAAGAKGDMNVKPLNHFTKPMRLGGQ